MSLFGFILALGFVLAGVGAGLDPHAGLPYQIGITAAALICALQGVGDHIAKALKKN